MTEGSRIQFGTVLSQPFADASHIVVLGRSCGVTTAITLAVKKPAGLLGTIDFAGGGGGDPVGRTYGPCRPDLLQDMLGEYGKTARISTLWMNAEYDKYFGPKHTKACKDRLQAVCGR